MTDGPSSGAAAAGGPARRGPRPAQDRLRRLLVVLPWLMERGSARLDEMSERFGVPERALLADLELAALCGLPPYVDELIDLWVDDGVVHVGVPRLFTRPLRLTAAEGFSLLAAGRAALELPGADPSGPLARALDKLAATLGAERPAIAVDLERPPQLDGVQAAVAASERLAVTYYTAGRDDLTERTIDPHGVFTERGHWYVVADDSRTGETRTFRIDRLEALAPTGEHFERRAVAPRFGAWFTDDEVLVATLSLPASAAWIVETYPIFESTPEPGDGGEGRLRVRLPVFSERWLARLLLRAGPEARVLEPGHLADVGRAAAATLLERYR